MPKTTKARGRKHDLPSWGHGPECVTCLETLPYGVDALLDAMSRWLLADPDGFYLPPAVRSAVDDLDLWNPVPGICWDSSEAEMVEAGML